MHYYILDLSCRNQDMPKARAVIKALGENGVRVAHDYGMSFSDSPNAWVDFYQSARSELTPENFRMLVRILMEKNSFPYQGETVSGLDPKQVTIRNRTYEQELA